FKVALLVVPCICQGSTDVDDDATVFKTPLASATTILSVFISPVYAGELMFLLFKPPLPAVAAPPKSNNSVGFAVASVPATPIAVLPFFNIVIAFLGESSEKLAPTCMMASSSVHNTGFPVLIALFFPITNSKLDA